MDFLKKYAYIYMYMYMINQHIKKIKLEIIHLIYSL